MSEKTGKARRALGKRKSKPQTKYNREMDRIALGWMVNYAKMHYWRVQSNYLGFDDLISEGHYVWAYVKDKYPKAKTLPHLMSLFKLAFNCHIHTLARKRTKEQTIVQYFEIEPQTLSPEYATLGTLLKNAPENIRDVLELFTSSGGRRGLRGVHRRRRNGSRETTNDKLCRLTGKSPDTNLVEEIHDYFSPA